jgi:thiol:disulfide interchange protein
MKNEIKSSIVRTSAAGLFALAVVAVTVASTTGLSPAAQGEPGRAKAVSQVGDLLWSTDLNSTLTQAKVKNKYVLADMYTDWCTWCKRLDRDTFANPAMMSYLNKKYLCVKVNAENPKGGKAAADKYKVFEFPCVLVFEPSGKLIGKIMGYHRPDEFQQTLEDLIKNPPSDPYAGN